jgi:polysaccharide pyruvyl transferase WcaK-like protein
MGLFDSLFGRKDDQQQPSNAVIRNRITAISTRAPRPQNADEQAIARYRYMLQTAPPEELERAHTEAFARLTPEQRQMVLEQMSQTVPESERRHLSDDPQSLARAATRAENARTRLPWNA